LDVDHFDKCTVLLRIVGFDFSPGSGIESAKSNLVLPSWRKQKQVRGEWNVGLDRGGWDLSFAFIPWSEEFRKVIYFFLKSVIII